MHYASPLYSLWSGLEQQTAFHDAIEIPYVICVLGREGVGLRACEGWLGLVVGVTHCGHSTIGEMKQFVCCCVRVLCAW